MNNQFSYLRLTATNMYFAVYELHHLYTLHNPFLFPAQHMSRRVMPAVGEELVSFPRALVVVHLISRRWTNWRLFREQQKFEADGGGLTY